MNSLSQSFKLVLLGASVAALAACGTPTSVTTETGGETFVSSLTIDGSQTRAELEAMYGGEVFVYEPAGGFALIRLDAAQAALSTLSDTLETNEQTFTLPEINTQGASAWADGASAWADGASAWADGASAWADGASAWADGASAWADGFAPWNGVSSTWQGGTQTYTPLDNHFAWQQIGLYEAHAEYAPKLGEGVKVAVIDTGIDLNHPVFAGRLAAGWDFIDDDADPQEEGKGANYGHGTAVAGVVLQVAPRATIMPYRVLNADGVGDTDDLALAIYHAVNAGADVINLSLGSSESSGAVRYALSWAKKQGVSVVTSVGNSGDKNVSFPGREAAKNKAFKDAVVSVGSVNNRGEKSLFSTYSKDGVELMAPGEFVLTAFPDRRVVYWSGTSFAAPMVTGAIALALGEPELEEERSKLSKKVADEAENDIYDLSVNKAFKNKLGKGVLDIPEFLEEVLDD